MGSQCYKQKSRQWYFYKVGLRGIHSNTNKAKLCRVSGNKDENLAVDTMYIV